MMTGKPYACKPVTLSMLLAAIALPALAADGSADRLNAEGARLALAPRPQEAAIPETTVAAPYGREGSEWILFGTGAAYDLDNNTDINLNIGYSRFLVDDVEWLLELAAWYHNQEGDDALSLNPAMEFRWHFYNDGDTSVFVNAGIGVLGATDNVPEMGTGFDFTPRAGIGLTHRISNDGTRLIAGVRWHHISNARVNGEAENPSRDAPMLYLQYAVPF
jgi:hypothetical protein